MRVRALRTDPHAVLRAALLMRRRRRRISPDQPPPPRRRRRRHRHRHHHRQRSLGPCCERVPGGRGGGRPRLSCSAGSAACETVPGARALTGPYALAHPDARCVTHHGMGMCRSMYVRLYAPLCVSMCTCVCLCVYVCVCRRRGVAPAALRWLSSSSSSSSSCMSVFIARGVSCSVTTARSSASLSTLGDTAAATPHAHTVCGQTH
jgi:hypothetical protein